MAHDDKKHYDDDMTHKAGTEDEVDLVGGEDTRHADSRHRPRHADGEHVGAREDVDVRETPHHAHENAPYNPLSPHADDPAFEPAPPKDDYLPGHGGEYDQTPYIARQGEDHVGPEGSGEYDQEPYVDRQAARHPDEPGIRDGREHGERGTRDPHVHDPKHRHDK